MVIILYIHKYLVSIYLSMCAALAKKTVDRHVKSGAKDTDFSSYVFMLLINWSVANVFYMRK